MYNFEEKQMKVHLIKKQTIENYAEKNMLCRVSFRHWLTLVKYADWDKPEDIIGTFNSADILGKGTNRVVFNIAGNNYRMICKYCFGSNKVHLFVNWIGTHAAYTKLCKYGEQYSVKSY